jgi:hypothetical protein
LYNEAQLYGGLFTIDTEHPEYTQQYWEYTIRGLWNLNSLTKDSKFENTAFLNQFPIVDSLLQWINDGKLVNNLWIPVKYPSADKEFYYLATLTPVDGSIDLSKIALSIYKPTIDEARNYSPNFARVKPGTTGYISYLGACEQVLVEVNNISSDHILSITYKSEVIQDTTYPGEEADCLALLPEKPDKDNLLAATQLILSGPLRWNLVSSPSGAFWIHTGHTPLVLNIDNIWPSPSAFISITTLDNTPLAIR